MWPFSKIFLLVEKLGAVVAFRKEKKQKLISIKKKELSHMLRDDLHGVKPDNRMMLVPDSTDFVIAVMKCQLRKKLRLIGNLHIRW